MENMMRDPEGMIFLLAVKTCVYLAGFRRLHPVFARQELPFGYVRGMEGVGEADGELKVDGPT